MRSISVISLAVLVWYSIAIRRSWFQNSGSTPSCQIVLRAFPDNDPHPAVQRCAHLRLMITLGPEDRLVPKARDRGKAPDRSYAPQGHAGLSPN
jgi:hypothetical protein